MEQGAPENYKSVVEKYTKEQLEELQIAITPEELDEICGGDADLERTANDMRLVCARYAADFWDMQRMIAEGNQDSQEYYLKSNDRHILHETLVDTIEEMVMQLKHKKKSVSWFQEIGYSNRAGCAKFAILYTLWYYLSLVDAKKGEDYEREQE